jgi:hypothetical protein
MLNHYIDIVCTYGKIGGINGAIPEGGQMGRKRTSGGHGEPQLASRAVLWAGRVGTASPGTAGQSAPGCEHRHGVAGTMWARQRQGCCSGKPVWGRQDAHAVSSGYVWPLRVRVGAQSLAGTRLLACAVVSRCESVGRGAAYQGWQSRRGLRARGSVASVSYAWVGRGHGGAR